MSKDHPRNVAIILQTCYFEYFGHAFLGQLKQSYQIAENFDFQLHAKNQIYLSPPSWNIAKIL